MKYKLMRSCNYSCRGKQVELVDEGRVFQDIETKEYFIYCAECEDSACMREVKVVQ